VKGLNEEGLGKGESAALGATFDALHTSVDILDEGVKSARRIDV